MAGVLGKTALASVAAASMPEHAVLLKNFKSDSNQQYADDTSAPLTSLEPEQTNITFPIKPPKIHIKIDKCHICEKVADKLVKAGGEECEKVCASATGPVGLVVCRPLCSAVKEGANKADVCKHAKLCHEMEEPLGQAVPQDHHHCAERWHACHLVPQARDCIGLCEVCWTQGCSPVPPAPPPSHRHCSERCRACHLV